MPSTLKFGFAIFAMFDCDTGNAITSILGRQSPHSPGDTTAHISGIQHAQHPYWKNKCRLSLICLLNMVILRRKLWIDQNVSTKEQGITSSFKPKTELQGFNSSIRSKYIPPLPTNSSTVSKTGFVRWIGLPHLDCSNHEVSGQLAEIRAI